MKRIIGSLLIVGIVSGCVSVDNGPETGGARPHWGKSYGPPTVPGVEGPYGTKVNMAAPYNTAPPGSSFAAAQMMRNTVPMSMVQMNPGGVMTPNGVPMPPMGPGGPSGPGPGLPFGAGGMPGMPPGGPGMPGMPPGGPGMPGMPPMGRAMPPMPGMPGMPGTPPMGGISQASFQSGAPNSGVVPANVPPGANPAGGVSPAQFAATSPVGPMFPSARTQVTFSTNPAGVMKVHWYSQGKDGKPNYSLFPLETPGKYNFAQGAIYRLKLTHIPGHPGLELYPTLEVVPTGPKTSEFLAHNSVPLVFTEADFKQVIDRNYIVKVIYLPDPQFQDSAGAGPDEIDSRRLEPGQDPIQEALRRGSILLVVRLGNIDQEVPNTPSMTAPPPGMKMPPMMGPPGAPGGFQVPYFGPGGPGGPNGMVPGPFPVPNGVGTDADRKKPSVLGPLPPLPGEPGNKGPLDLPFGPAPAIKPDLPVPPAKNDVNKLAPFAPLPPMNLLLPGEEKPNPLVPVVPPNVAPQNVAPKKVDIVPPVEQKIPAIPAIPVSSPKPAATKDPVMPAIPEFTVPPIPTELKGTPMTEQPKVNPIPAPPVAEQPKVNPIPAPPVAEQPKVNPIPAPPVAEQPKVNPIPAPPVAEQPKVNPIPAPPVAEQPANVSGKFELPTIPLPTLPMRADDGKVSGSSIGSSPAPVAPISTPGLPPIPEFLGGSDLPSIPSIPPMNNRK